MTADPLDWLLGLEHLGMKFGLENMTQLTAALGHPERHFHSIHVAGTNGKGSVTAMVETALRSAGFRSARYTSPHLERLEERFVVSGEEVPTALLRTAAGTVRAAVAEVQRRTGATFTPTFFECATASAFELFRSERVEVAVLETGLGGRLDATNVVQPVVTAITSIDFDHQSLLGNTLASIAAEKAGIIKPGVPVVIGPLGPEAEGVIARFAEQQQAPLIRVGDPEEWLGQLTPALRGAHQRGNSAVAIAVLRALRGQGIEVPEAAVAAGVESVRWPGRLEHIVAGPTEFLIDAAHNPGGARALAAYLRELGWGDAALVFGAMADKDAEGMLEALVPAVAFVITTTAASPRAESGARLAELARRNAGAVTIRLEEDPARALALAATLSRRVVVAGSIFLAGPLRGILR